MNKTAIKNFAIWARNKLIADISYRAGLMGITADGIHPALPQSTGQTKFYDIGTPEPYAISGEAIHQREHLADLIRRKAKNSNYQTAYKYIIEEVAYTWFNRLIAVRFMEVNDYLPSHIRVLSSDQGKIEPDLVTTPFDADLDFTRNEQHAIIDLKNDNKLDELFRLLFIKQCNALNEILPDLFEKTNDYTELLLNLSVIDQDGVVYHLVHDIPEEDFDIERGGQVEIIGWLYQYYNTELNEQVYDGNMSKERISKEMLPAATTIYTPDWAVRYMTENSVGRLWLEGHPNSELKAGWKYYLDEAKQENNVQSQLTEIRNQYAMISPEDIKVIDPCMGSGHILVYVFEVLMQIYESAGYSRREASRSIIENNVYGLDIDDRAFQIAYFAVMMKARQYNRRILNGKYKPNLYSIIESNDIYRNQLRFLGGGMKDNERERAISQINNLLDAFIDAKEVGSILTIDTYDWNLLYRFVSSTKTEGQISFETMGLEETQKKIGNIINQGRLLSQKYEVVITNPPYLSSSRFSPKLDAYVKANYEDSKNDLSMTMYKRSITKLSKKNCFVAFITTSSWMYLSSFKKLRKYINDNTSISSLVDFGTELFEGKVGHNPIVSWVTRSVSFDYMFKAIRLVDYCYSRRDEKEAQFFNLENVFFNKQSNLEAIPDAPLAYWVSNPMLQLFDRKSLDQVFDLSNCIQPGDSERFLRTWNEVSLADVGKKWIIISKGGNYRKWYGNVEYVILYENDGERLRQHPKATLRTPEKYYQHGYVWTRVTSSDTAFRDWNARWLVSDAGPIIYSDDYSLLGYLNSKVARKMLRMINPTLNCQVGNVGSLPFLKTDGIVQFVMKCIELSRLDWDSFEESMDFKRHPLVGRGVNTIENAFSIWSDECNERFTSLKSCEEKINSELIEVFGLSQELTPDIRDEDITIHKADLKRDIKNLLSYAVGCMLGRYSLDKDGVVLAGGELQYKNYRVFNPDTDNIIPVTDEEYLEDDIVTRFCSWLQIVYGTDSLEENLDYIASVLDAKGSTSREVIRSYFVNDFYKNHCSKYTATGAGKRPIYWLFDSGKQNGFKALIYLHRYNADTIGNLRIDYLHRMQRIYESEIGRMQDMIVHSTNAREAGQATKRKDKLTKQLKECREYDEKLAHLALSRIELDLDDGVKVNYRKMQTANDGKFYEVLADSKNIMAKK